MERLRGNTFLLLLLRGGCQVLLNPQEYGESKEGVTKPNMLADLIRLTNTNYQPAKIETLASYFSKYLSGDPPRSPSYLPFNNPAYQRGLESRIEDNYPAVLRQMDRFCRKYLTQENYPLRLLVAGLVDAILADDSFDGEFDVGEKTVSKADLNGETHFLLQPFLASIWSNILANHPDTSEGAETYLAWTEDAGYNSAREITTTNIKNRSNGIELYFHPLFAVSQARISELIFELGICGKYRKFNELNHSHWSVKQIDLIEVLNDAGLNPFAR